MNTSSYETLDGSGEVVTVSLGLVDQFRQIYSSGLQISSHAMINEVEMSNPDVYFIINNSLNSILSSFTSLYSLLPIYDQHLGLFTR